MIDLTQIIVAILTLVISLISAFLVPFLKSKISAEQLEKIKFWVNVAVEAAEQMYIGSGKGAAKKAYVMSFLESKGFTLNADEIDALIEGAVMELHLEQGN